MVSRLQGAAPMMFQNNFSPSQAPRSSDKCKNPKEVAGLMIDNSYGWAGNFMLMMELRKKILTFRDIIDLPPCDSSGPIHELVMGTVEDFHKLYPNVVPRTLISEMKETSIYQGLAHLYYALKSIGDSWAKNHKWITDFGHDTDDNLKNINLEQLGGRVLAKLAYMIKVARKMFDVMEEDEKNNEGRIQDSTFGDTLRDSYSDINHTCPSPVTPALVPPELTLSMKLGEFADVSYSPPLLLPLRLQALGKLKPNDVKCLSFQVFPHASAQGSSSIKEKNKTVDKPKIEIEAKSTAEDSTAIVTNEGPKDSNTADSLLKAPIYASTIVPEVREPALVPPPPPPPPSLSILPPSVSANAPPPAPNPHLNLTAVPAPPLILLSKGSLPALNAVPPSPPILPSKGSLPPPPPPMSQTKGAAPPPPPPLGVAKALRPKKATTKLKRSTHMGNLYRDLKGKVEGSNLNGKLSQGRKAQVGGASGGKQGMADALAEITKRSAYFQQIEEDVQKHAKSIMEIKAAISSFQTKDMTELLKFHKYVEQHLEELTDETQVLARFEGFPTKKLESLRTAAALYSKLEGIAANLGNWKIVPPLRQLLDKVESYFNKIKGEVDALERSKDEESKRFQSHNIHFDFNILVRIKESMVDVSSNCMELALKECREARAAAKTETGCKTECHACTKMLWKAFQLAFRVYSFAGGQDDRADKLTKELAQEIETGPRNE